jgi:sec-independent protein translocase protein TatC
VGEGRSLPVTEHLEELRGRLIISLVALVVATLASIPFADDLVIFLARPLEELQQLVPEPETLISVTLGADGTWRGEIPEQIPPALRGKMVTADEAPLVLIIEPASGEGFSVIHGRREAPPPHYFNLTDPIYLIFKAAVLLGLCVATPIIFHQIWLFVAPGLTQQERAVVRPTVFLFFFAFPIGAAFAYVLLRFAVPILTGFSFGGMVFLPDITRYVPFALTMMIAFGLVFETPGVIWLLGRAGLVNSRWLAHRRRYALGLIFLLAAFFTPPDVFTQIAMAIPLILLFELSIWLVRMTERGRGAVRKAK